jgi:hypothetical protein
VKKSEKIRNSFPLSAVRGGGWAVFDAGFYACSALRGLRRVSGKDCCAWWGREEILGPASGRFSTCLRQCFGRQGSRPQRPSRRAGTGELSGGGESTTLRVNSVLLHHLPPRRSRCLISVS